MPDISLFMIPFAGGSRYSFEVFKTLCGDKLNVCCLELPGRGARMEEPLLSEIAEMSDDVFEQIKDRLYQPYAVFGHSMGAIIGYLVVKKIHAAGLPMPLCFFPSGRGGPSADKNDRQYHLLPRDQFFVKLKELNGMPEAFFEDASLLEFFEPIIRADFKAIETYSWEQTPPFDVPVCVITGTNDDITMQELQAWQHETTAPAEVTEIEGTHFFLFEHPHQVAEIILKKLSLYAVRY